MLRKLARVMFNVLTALSLLLLAVVAGLWARSSGGFIETLDYSYEPRRFLSSGQGAVTYSEQSPGGVSGSPTAVHGWNFLGFASYGTDYPRGSDYELSVPYWFLALVAAARPAWCLARWRRRRQREAAGRCPACGYDLRATPGRCPECGIEPSAELSH